MEEKTLKNIVASIPKREIYSLGVVLINSISACYLTPENKWLYEQDLDAYRNRERRLLQKNLSDLALEIAKNQKLQSSNIQIDSAIEVELKKSKTIPEVNCLLDGMFVAYTGLQSLDNVRNFLTKNLRSSLKNIADREVNPLTIDWENKQQYLAVINRLKYNFLHQLNYKV